MAWQALKAALLAAGDCSPAALTALLASHAAPAAGPGPLQQHQQLLDSLFGHLLEAVSNGSPVAQLLTNLITQLEQVGRTGWPLCC
jgi:hypothetical protein